MKYIYVLFLFVSFATLAEDNLSYRFKYTSMKVDTELNYQTQFDLYVGDFLLSKNNTQSQTMKLKESLSVLEFGVSYNWKYLILSADYAFNVSGDDGEAGKQELDIEPVNASIFGDEQLDFDTSLIIDEVEYNSGQVSIGFGNGNINVFAGYKIDTQITSMSVESYINFNQDNLVEADNLILDNVVKGPFAGVSLLYDVTDDSYLAVKLALTQYESGHLMLSNETASFNEPLTGKALSFSTRWTGKIFFIGFQGKYYQSDENKNLSMERSEIGLDVGIHFL